MSLKNLLASLKVKNNFVVTTHRNMEGDALGSELAFYALLKALGKKVTVVNEDRVSREYNFLPFLEKVRTVEQGISRIRCDCFVTLDCSDLERCGKAALLLKKAKPLVINIDHHVSNARFGDINWVEANTSSASEMVYTLYKKLGVPFTKESATLLYVGIMTDTGSFRYNNTTRNTHQAVAHLLQYGVDVPQIYRKLYEDISFADMKFLNRIAGTLRSELGGKVIWVKIPSSSLKGQKSSFDFSDHLLGFARAIRGVEVAVLFREGVPEKNAVRVNFRSQGTADVSKIASYFGGGGHKAASGCTVAGTLSQVEKKVLAKVKQALSQKTVKT